MFNRIREKRHIDKFFRKDLQVLFSEIEKIRTKSDILAICPGTTGSNWMGVMNATLSLFPENTFIIPQYFSDPVYTEKELKEISDKIIALRFEKIVFSGFPDYFSTFIESVHSVKKYVVFHGSFSELSGTNSLGLILKFESSGKLSKIGFVKKGLSEYFRKTCDVKCCDLFLKTSLTENIGKKILEGTVNIGVFGNSNFNKNIHNQVAAALTVKESKVHVISDADFSYLCNTNRIIKHGKLERENFLGLLASMTINSHISFSESWGQIVTESLALGVPCLTSDNNGILDYDDYLAEKLIVRQYDNPVAIARQIEKVLSEREKISVNGIEYIKKLNIIADQKLTGFLAD